MNLIELEESHRSKLLEMCNLLFSEYKFEFIRAEDEYGYTVYDLIMLGLISDFEDCNFENSRKCFHWFEFCMTYLADKIFEDHDNLSGIKNSFITIFCIKDEHPINYLYEQFKQLKINK